MKSVPGDALPVSEYYKAAVYDAKDAKIGDVEDVLLDRNGKVDAVILGVGRGKRRGGALQCYSRDREKWQSLFGDEYQGGAAERTQLHLRPYKRRMGAGYEELKRRRASSSGGNDDVAKMGTQWPLSHH
jgi:sporulation protein YlmC with PRC-barrel domain